MDKRHIIREKKAEYIKNERNILDKLTYDGVVRLYFTFQDENNLCILYYNATNVSIMHLFGGVLRSCSDHDKRLCRSLVRTIAHAMLVQLSYTREGRIACLTAC
jgi:serine/threonine protein kinase